MEARIEKGVLMGQHSFNLAGLSCDIRVQRLRIGIMHCYYDRYKAWAAVNFTPFGKVSRVHCGMHGDALTTATIPHRCRARSIGTACIHVLGYDA